MDHDDFEKLAEKELTKLNVEQLSTRLQSIMTLYYIIQLVGCICFTGAFFLAAASHFVLAIVFALGAGVCLIVIDTLRAMRNKVQERLQIVGKYKE